MASISLLVGHDTGGTDDSAFGTSLDHCVRAMNVSIHDTVQLENACPSRQKGSWTRNVSAEDTHVDVHHDLEILFGHVLQLFYSCDTGIGNLRATVI